MMLHNEAITEILPGTATAFGPEAMTTVRNDTGAESSDEFNRLFECANHAVMQIEADGKLVRANARAHRALALARMLHLEHGRVQPCRSNYTADWRRSLLNAGNGDAGLAFVGDGRNEVAVAVGRSGERLQSTGQAPTLLLIMSADSACDDTALTQYARNHQLTPAEQRVLARLLEGLAPCEIAYEYDIAENTVRSQIKSVLAKTGNHSIRNLLLNISRLPPVSYLESRDIGTTSRAAVS